MEISIMSDTEVKETKVKKTKRNRKRKSIYTKFFTRTGSKEKTPRLRLKVWEVKLWNAGDFDGALNRLREIKHYNLPEGIEKELTLNGQDLGWKSDESEDTEAEGQTAKSQESEKETPTVKETESATDQDAAEGSKSGTVPTTPSSS
jgi:ribosomal protein L20A (L18A)